MDTARKFPFIYISALRRTRSTVLSEMLTQLPYAFIIREPHFGKNIFLPKQDDVVMFRTLGIDLERFLMYRLPLAFLMRRLRIFGYRQDYMVRTFKQKLLPRFQQRIKQVGIKEITHQGWENYIRHFPNMKVIMTGRDPRDIFLSKYKRWKKKLINPPQGVTPENLSMELNYQFRMQMALRKITDCMEIRYEDLCLDKSIFNRIKDFVESPIPEMGEVGQFIIRHPKRGNEYNLHGDQLTSKSVQRWKRESDPNLVKNAHHVFESMPEYTKFWGYKK